MCKHQSMNTYNPYSERYGISSDEDLKKAMQSMKENEDYPIYKDGQEESKFTDNIYWICMKKMICLQ